jgi:C1A family cysteine protease
MPEENNDLDLLRQRNQDLSERLAQYKALEEDLMAQRVFEKARKQFVWMLTVGGLASIVAGVLGLKGLDDYAKARVDNALKSKADSYVDALLKAEVHDQISTAVQGQREFIRQQIFLASQPQGISANGPTTLLHPVAVLTQIDYTSDMLPVRDQGPEGSNAAFAVAAALEYQYKKKFGHPLRISPRFLYNSARKLEGYGNVDHGAHLGDVVRIAQEQGVVEESVWPYVPLQYASEAPAGLETARHYKINRAVPLRSLTEIKSALATGPVVATVAYYSTSFLSDETRRSGIVYMPAPGEPSYEGLAICIVGYNDAKRLLKVELSWGTDTWGEHGYGYLPYEYTDKFLGTDNWALSF